MILNFILICLFALFVAPSNVAPASNTAYTGSFKNLVSKSPVYSNSSFLLNKLTFESDVPFNKAEFLYLTELKENTFVTAQQVAHSYRQLSQKKAFSAINIDISDEGSGKHLHFKLSGSWIFKKLILDGLTFGKSQYIKLYEQQPGTVFDASLHDESIKLIKKFLIDQGYFNATLNDELVYSKRDKTITVKIKLHRGERFAFENVKFVINDLRSESRITNETDTQKIKNMKSVEDDLNKNYLSALKDDYSKKKIKKTIKKIKTWLKQKGYLNTKISMSRKIYSDSHKLDVIINITLGQRKVLKFKGNTVFSENQLRDDVLAVDEPGWLFSPDIISEQIQNEYYKKGYWHVEIIQKRISDDGLLFEINEGRATLIEQIEIKDEQSLVAEQGNIFWDSLLKNKKFDQQLLDDGIEKLKNFYISNGFWDFKVVDQKFTRNPETGEYLLKIFIFKGDQRLWSGLEVKGFPDVEKTQYFQKFKNINPKHNVPFNLSWISEQQSFLFNYFQKLGYWYAEITPEFIVLSKNRITKQTYNQKILLRWIIKPGERVRFGKILLRGITNVPFKKIVKELKFKEGELWSREKIDLTRKKLKRLDTFKTVQIQPYQLSKNKSKKPVIMTLIDDDPAELRLRVGYYLTNKNFLFQRQSTPKVGASFILKNPLHQADKLNIDADWTKFESKLNLEYQQPSPLNTTAMGKFKGYANKYICPVQIGSSGSAYEAVTSGFLFGLNDEYKKDYFWGVNVGNEWIRTSRVRGFLKFNRNLIDTTLPYVFVEPSLVIDKLDDKINTTSGSLTFFSIKCMIPENRGSVTARLQVDESLFYPIFEKIILAGRLRLGYLFRQKFEDVVPMERFYLGGPNSVRGYEKDSIPPLGVIEKNSSGAIIKEYTTYGDMNVPKGDGITREYTIQGGSAMLNGNFELRFPIYKSFGGVFFQDIGILSQSGFSGFKGTWFPASGFGCRYKTPIGALRFDMGWKWKRRFDSDIPYAIHFTLGEVF